MCLYFPGAWFYRYESTVLMSPAKQDENQAINLYQCLCVVPCDQVQSRYIVTDDSFLYLQSVVAFNCL